MEKSANLPRGHEFHVALDRYSQINPAYENAIDPSKYETLDRDLRQELQDVFIDPKTGEALPEAEIQINLDIIITSLVSRIRQVETPEEQENPDHQSQEAIRAFFDVVKSILSHPLDRQNEEGVVVDSRRITDSLLNNLGLKDFVPGKRTRQGDKVARRAEAIPSIKSMLPYLEPINAPGQSPTRMRHFRLMRMTTGPSEGYVLGTQTINNKKILFKSDLHGASRRVKHIEGKFKNEIDVLVKIQKVLQNALENPADWGDIDDKVLAEIRSQLVLCVNDLKNVTNKEKVTLREAIKKALTFRKDNGVENPDVKGNLKIALDQLSARVNGIDGISQFLTSDRIKLDAMIGAQTKPLEDFLAKVNAMHQSFRLLHPETQITPGKKAEIIKNLQELKAFADGQKFEPYLSFGRKFSAEIYKVISALESGDRVSVAQEFVKSYLIAKLEKGYKDILDVYEKISLHPDLVNSHDISFELKRLEQALRNHDVAPGIKTNEYDGAYIEVYRLLNSLKKRLWEITPNQLDLDFDAPPSPSSSSRPAETQKSRINQVLDLVEKIPKIGGIVSELRALFNLVFKVEKPAHSPRQAQSATPVPTRPQPVVPHRSTQTAVISVPAPEPAKIVTKQQAYSRMKENISKLDFRDLAQNLPV